jgi:hypothetical protein
MNIVIKAYKGPHTSYAEVGQTNPLRWECLYKESEGVFSKQSKLWKCKDFLNEIVAKYHGHLLGCYGFTADSVQTNEEGVYVLLTNIVDKDVYRQNIGSINSLAAAQGFPTIELIDADEGFVCLLPRKYFETTYPVSLLTYLMRVANTGTVVTDALWLEHPTKSIDNPFASVYAEVMKQGFKTPDNVGNSYYYYGKSHDYSKKPKVEMVHNCGVAQWTVMLKAEKLADTVEV